MMASFERYTGSSRGGSQGETRFESWVVAHSKNCSEQKLLKNRLRDLDKERARSLYLLNMERRIVKKDHNQLLLDKRTMMNSPYFDESSTHGNPRKSPVNPAMSVRYHSDRIQERLKSWNSEMDRRCQSASPRISSTFTTDSPTDQPTPEQPPGKLSHQRPFSSGNVNSKTTVPAVKQNGETAQSDVDDQHVISSTKLSTSRGSKPLSVSPRRRARQAEIDRMVQSKVSRLRTLSRVPADFNIRAKTMSVSRSGQPQISLNFFDEHHVNGKSHGKSIGSPSQGRRKTHAKTR